MTDPTALAIEAAEAWGGLAHAPRFIRDRENAVFEVHLNAGRRAALRLHRSGYQTRSAIEAEILWTEALAAKDFPCPKPIRTRDGAPVFQLEAGPVVSVIEWIDATPIGENGVAFTGTLDEQLALYRDLGNLIAKLHQTTTQIETTDWERPSWDLDALLGEAPVWGQFWDNPSLSRKEVDLLQHARENAAQHLSQLNLPIQLIHADLLQENILRNQQGLWIIDFDDSGLGYTPYDLGTALIQHAEHPHLPRITEALCAGYGLSDGLVEAMPLFIMLRSMASCGWVISRADSDDPRQRFYAERALKCARTYLD